MGVQSCGARGGEGGYVAENIPALANPVNDAILAQMQPAALPRPKCAELPGRYLGENHAECWEEIATPSECYLWRTHYHSDQIINWTGSCRNGVAEGHGVYSVSAGSEHSAYEGRGTVVGGKASGHWIDKWADGARHEGDYRGGKRHGHWVERFANGSVAEGPYVDGKRHGHWVVRFASGNVGEGPYVNGKKNGRWVVRFASGGRLEEEYWDGSRESQPGAYVTKDGERHPGIWSDGCFRGVDGKVWARAGNKSRADCRSENPAKYAKSTLSSNKLGKNAGKAIGQWPAAKKADQNWEWDRIFVFLIQSALAAQGFDPGKPDGVMGPNTMMALIAWHGKGNEHLLEGLIPTVARLLYETLRAVGLSPGPLDEILGSESVAALREWDEVYSSARVASINGVDAVTIKGTITQDLAKSTSPRDKKLVAAKKAPPPRAEKRAPAEGELWGAHVTYNFDSTSGDDGYGLALNHPSPVEALKRAINNCERVQPAHRPRNKRDDGCENNLTAFSTSASNKRIPLREAKTYGLVDSFYANNARCIGIFKFRIYPKGHHISDYNFHSVSGNTEEEVIALIKQLGGDRDTWEIDQIACNDR